MNTQTHVVAEVGMDMSFNIVHTAPSKSEAAQWARANLKIFHWEDDETNPGCADILTTDFRQFVLQAGR